MWNDSVESFNINDNNEKHFALCNIKSSEVFALEEKNNAENKCTDHYLK